MIITEILVGSASAVCSPSMWLINPGASIITSSSTALLTSFAILITNEFISKSKIRYTTLRDWINVITFLLGKTLKTSMIDKEIDEKKEAEELKKINNHYLNKRKEIKKNTSFKVEDVFGDVISKDSFSQKQITVLNKFSAKKM